MGLGGIRRRWLSIVFMLAAAGCGDDDAGHGVDGDTGTTDAGNGLADVDLSDVRWSDVQPILQAKCGSIPGCHGTGICAAASCFATNYDAHHESSASCSGEEGNLLRHECVLRRILDGSMPSGQGCSGDPAADSDRPNCIQAYEFEILEAWSKAGAPE